MKRGTKRFAAACWHELMRFLMETISEDEENMYPAARDMMALAVNIERKVERGE